MATNDGEVTAELFGFLTCAPNREVAPIHPKEMPIILTTPQGWRYWLTAPSAEALRLQRPLDDGMLQIVAEGLNWDGASAAFDLVSEARERHELAEPPH